MISSVELFFDDEENVKDIASIRRNLRDKSNPLELPSALFKAYFGLAKDAVVYVVETLKDDFKESYISTGIPPLLKVCAALRFLEDGSFQKSHGNDFNNCMAQSTLSSVLKEVVHLIEDKLCQNGIVSKLTEEEKRQNKKIQKRNSLV
ncbi:uncharacterized protein [Musca autumnalis]|uniref:uncharacterized protein n=1 Tax=Musca autumnalis TaxID=221902 RepID=UPI003CFA00FA